MQVPQLQADILIPDYCSVGGGDMKSINAWLGPTGTITPLHHDPYHNLFAQVSMHRDLFFDTCHPSLRKILQLLETISVFFFILLVLLLLQVVGRKYVRLYPPNATQCLYPYSEAMLSNSSQVCLYREIS